MICHLGFIPIETHKAGEETKLVIEKNDQLVNTLTRKNKNIRTERQVGLIECSQ